MKSISKESNCVEHEHGRNVLIASVQRFPRLFELLDVLHLTYVNTDSLKLMHQSLVLAYLGYCSLVWAKCNQTLKSKVQRLHNRAARVITGDSYDIRSKNNLIKLGWKNLEGRRIPQTEAYNYYQGFTRKIL